MSVPNAACTGCVVVLNDQQTVIQHQRKITLAKPDLQPQKLCTVVENGRVVVRPIAPEQASD